MEAEYLLDSAIFNALNAKNVSAIRTFLESCTHSTASRVFGTSMRPCEVILHAAVKKGQLDFVKLLLQEHNNIYVNSCDNQHFTALIYAVIQGDKDIVELLFEHGATFSSRLPNKELHVAITNGNREIVESLLSRGAKVNGKCWKSDCKPIELAIGHRNEGILELLLQYGAQSIDQALQLAVKLMNKNLAALLLQYGANPNYDGARQDVYPLHRAVVMKNKEMINLLLDYGGDINICDYFNLNATVLHLGAMYGTSDVLKLLISRGANIHVRNDQQFTPLHYAVCYSDREETVKILFNKGLSLEDKEFSGKTPLFLAVETGNFEGVQLLLDLGADLNAEDNKGCCVLADASNFMTSPKYLSIAKCLVKRVGLMKLCKLQVSEKNLSAIGNNFQLASFLRECENEIESMKSERCGESKIYCQDILKTRSVSQLAVFARNKGVRQFFKLNDIKRRYPIYGDKINENIRKGFAHGQSLGKLENFFQYLAVRKDDKLPNLPVVCVCHVLSYFSLEDKLNLKFR